MKPLNTLIHASQEDIPKVDEGRFIIRAKMKLPWITSAAGKIS